MAIFKVSVEARLEEIVMNLLAWIGVVWHGIFLSDSIAVVVKDVVGDAIALV